MIKYLIKKIDPQITNNEPKVLDNKSKLSNNELEIAKNKPVILSNLSLKSKHQTETNKDIRSCLKEKPSSFLDLPSTSDKLSTSEVLSSTYKRDLSETKTKIKDNVNKYNFFPDQSKQ